MKHFQINVPKLLISTTESVYFLGYQTWAAQRAASSPPRMFIEAAYILVVEIVHANECDLKPARFSRECSKFRYRLTYHRVYVILEVTPSSFERHTVSS